MKISILIIVLDEKVTADIAGGCGVPGETASCVAGPTLRLTTDANSCVSKNELGNKAAKEEDNGRSGGSSDNVNNAGIKKGYHSNHTWLFITQELVNIHT